ncbi:MAG: sodium pump decarboxylase gamma subunit [Clostridia bacterium]|nr:sodium pump decarboxylase gamma subunit [Clostridia bacterium]
MHINTDTIIQAANYLWQGMLGIFVVMIIISLIVYLLTKITK